MHDLLKASRHRTKGFTLVELVVITPIVMLLIGGIVAALVTTVGEAIATHTKNTLTYDIQDSLNRIEHDVELSNRFLATTDIEGFELVSPQGVNNGSQDFENASSSGNALLLLTPLTDRNPIDPDRSLVHYPDGSNNCSNPQFMMMGIVAYYVKDDALWRRTIMPADYASGGCTTPWQLPSCDPSISHTFCASEDMKLATGIADDAFLVDYYTSPQSSVEISDASDPSSSTQDRQYGLDDASTVRVQITANKLAGRQDVTRTLSGYATKLTTYNPDDPGVGAPGGGDPPGGGGDPDPDPEAPTVYATDDFVGSNGSPWNSSKWALGMNPTGGGWSATIRDNRGRLTSGSGSSWSYAGSITRRLVMTPAADVEVTGTFEFGTSSNMVYIWVREEGDLYWNSGYGLWLSPSWGSFDIDCGLNCSSSFDNHSVSMYMSVGTKYSFRYNVVGNRVRVNIWPASGSEPSGWMYDQTDTNNSSPNPGYVGISLESGNNDRFFLHDITVTSAE